MISTVERKVVELAREHLNVLTAQQLESLGVTRHLISRNLQSGTWRRAYKGIYRIGTEWTVGSLQRAALLAAGPDAALSHKSAAIKWGLEVPPCPMIQITIPNSQVHQPMPGVELFRSRAWNPADAVVLGHFRVTPLGQTVAALTTQVSRDELRVCLDSAARQGREVVNAIIASLPAQSRGHRGIETLRELLKEYGGGQAISASALESLALGIIEEAQVGPAVRHAWEHDEGFCAELDYAWLDELVDFELDGYADHGTREQQQRDKVRDRTLQWMGWRVLRFTWDEAIRKRQMVIDELRTHLAQRRANPPRFTSRVPRCPPP